MEINGKPVEDATSPLKVIITPRDCSLGQVKNPATCAVSRAIVRGYKCISARVHVSKTYIEFNNRWVRYQTPEALTYEIRAFDRGGRFEPGDYMLVPVSPGQTLIALEKRRSTKSDKRTRHDNNTARRQLHRMTGIRPKGGNR
jgi:hypothetical protein